MIFFGHKGTRALRSGAPSCLCAFVALSLFSQTLLAQEAAPRLVAEGDRLLARGDAEAAEEAYERALEEDKNLLAAYAGLARVAFEEAEWQEASGWADELLRRDPESLEGHYLRGIAERERAKFRTLLQRQHWRTSERDFTFVLARDSLYRDVLYQFALLRRYGEAYREAVRLGEAQVRLEPELVEAQVGLFRLYGYLVRHGRTSEVIAWLEGQDSDYARYALGEALRRDGRLGEADDVFARLLQDETDVPPQPSLLARARVHYAQDRPDEAQAFVEEATRRIDGALGAALVFEDAKYVIGPDELSRYRALETAEDYRAFFQAFWAKRDPTPARDVNARLAEHYRRLLKAEGDYAYDGFRHWHTDPDRLGELRLPETHDLEAPFNDRGLVYVRHGEPDDRVVTVGGAGTPPTVSWRYYDPAMDFHFLTAGTDNDWRLTPRLPPNGDVFEDREYWGGLYVDLARLTDPARASRSRSALEYEELKGRMVDARREDAARAFTTDRHTWDADVESLEMPHFLAAFRGRGGGAELEIHYALPLGRITEALGADVRPISIETGYALHDTTWRLVERETETKRVPPSLDRTSALVDFFRLDVRPGPYRVALHGQPEGTGLLGGDTLTHRVPDFRAPGLALSDVLLAYEIGPADVADPSRYDRRGLHLAPNPLARYAGAQPIALYFEVYGLARDAEDQTHYQLDYALTPQEAERRFLGLFRRGDRPALTLRTEREGDEADSVEHAEIDAGEVDRGRYTLTVRVTDLHAGTTRERSVAVELVD